MTINILLCLLLGLAPPAALAFQQAKAPNGPKFIGWNDMIRAVQSRECVAAPNGRSLYRLRWPRISTLRA